LTALGGKSKKLRKQPKNKSIKSVQNNEKIWGKYGSVWSNKKNHYIRLGSSEAFNVIRDELIRNKEWHKRVKFMAKGPGEWGNKLKPLL
jgi:hypothetical protein